MKQKSKKTRELNINNSTKQEPVFQQYNIIISSQNKNQQQKKESIERPGMAPKNQSWVLMEDPEKTVWTMTNGKDLLPVGQSTLVGDRV